MVGHVVLTGVCKQFKGRTAIHDVELTLDSGEIVCIIGPSGAGKSTLLRIVAGLESADVGQVTVSGRVGMIFQQGHLWPHRRAVDNVAGPLLHVARKSPDEARQAAYACLERFGVASIAHAYPETLSGGEAQRVAIARTLVMEPDVLLLDEVTSALDGERAQELMLQLIALSRQDDRALALVTHDVRLAAAMADRVVFMDGGRIVEQGPASQVLHRPEEVRTKSFLASALR